MSSPAENETSTGILYIATGQKYIDEAKQSASITNQITDTSITLVADRAVECPHFDRVIVDEDPHNDYLDKPRNLLKTPYDKTLFLDTDAYLIRDIPELFELVETFDVGVAVDPNEAALRKEELRYFDDLPESVPEFNTGVIAYRDNERSRELLQTWIERYSKSHIMDQPSFRKALQEASVAFTPLSTVYNCLLDYPMQVTGEVKIVHDLHGYLTEDNIREVETKVNRSTGVRVFHSRHEEVAYPISNFGDQVTKSLWWINQKIVQIIYLVELFRRNTAEKGLSNSLFKTVRYVIRAFV